MAHQEGEDTAEKEVLQIGLDRAILKNIITHNFKYIKPVAQKKIHGWKGNRAILVKKQKTKGVSKPGNVLCRAGSKNCLQASLFRAERIKTNPEEIKEKKIKSC